MAAQARGAARRDASTAPDRRSRAGAEAAPAATRSQRGEPSALRVLGPRELALRARRRQASRLAALAAAVVVGALLVVAGAQALVADHQVRIDDLQQELASTTTRNQGLELTRATLGAPSRVLRVAEHDLRMVSPGSVDYLTPVDPGPSVVEVAEKLQSRPARA